MSTELKKIKNTGKEGVDLQFTTFYGGKDKGKMVQLTQGIGCLLGDGEPGYIQLTMKDIPRVIKRNKEVLK